MTTFCRQESFRTPLLSTFLKELSIAVEDQNYTCEKEEGDASLTLSKCQVGTLCARPKEHSFWHGFKGERATEKWSINKSGGQAL